MYGAYSLVVEKMEGVGEIFAPPPIWEGLLCHLYVGVVMCLQFLKSSCHRHGSSQFSSLLILPIEVEHDRHCHCDTDRYQAVCDRVVVKIERLDLGPRNFLAPQENQEEEYQSPLDEQLCETAYQRL